MNGSDVVVDPPVKGEWAILNPPGHPKLALDLLATEGSRLPYRGSALFRHLFASIGVEATYAWRQPVLAPLDGVVVACHDGTPDRKRVGRERKGLSNAELRNGDHLRL